jgi:lipopolysaccharide assembly outer membrane protein LptD (OstA)
VLKGGYVTTCDSDVPHYRLSAKEIQFFMNEKIVARHVILYLGNVPVLYVPYFVQPILDVKTKVTVLPGYTKEWGIYVLGS